MVPKHEVTEEDLAVGSGGVDEGILTKNETEKLEKWHEESALGHWGIMRVVLPDHVWENW